MVLERGWIPTTNIITGVELNKWFQSKWFHPGNTHEGIRAKGSTQRMHYVTMSLLKGALLKLKQFKW